MDGRIDAIVEVHHHLDAGGRRGVGDRLGLDQRRRQRLLAHDVLAGRDRRHDDVAMREIGRRDGDGLDVRIGDQVAIIGIDALGAELPPHLFGAGRVEVADGVELGALDRVQRLAVERAPETGADDAEARLAVLTLSSRHSFYPFTEPKVSPRTT